MAPDDGRLDALITPFEPDTLTQISRRPKVDDSRLTARRSAIEADASC